MADVFENFGYDIGVNATGDLAVVSGPSEVTQQLLRSLFSSQGSYIWHTEYGVGAGEDVGTLASQNNLNVIRQKITQQLFLNDQVARIPAPVVDLQVTDDGVFANVSYTFKPLNTVEQLTFTIEG